MDMQPEYEAAVEPKEEQRRTEKRSHRSRSGKRESDAEDGEVKPSKKVSAY